MKKFTVNGSIDTVGSGAKFSHLFFYFTLVLGMLGLLAFILCGCSGDAQNDEANPTVENVTFVLNNGEYDVVKAIDDEVPIPTKTGCYLYGWYADEDYSKRIEFNTIADILSENNINKFSNGEFILYAKWQPLKNMTGVQMKDPFLIYDGLSHKPLIEGLPNGAEVEYLSDCECIDAGEYDVAAVVKAYGYYDLKLEGTLTIRKAKLDISDIKFEDKTVQWDGSIKSIEISGELPNGVSVTYQNNYNSEAEVYEVIAVFDCGKNYEAVPEMRAILTILACNYEITFVEEDGTSRVITVQRGAVPDNIPNPIAKRGYVAKWSIDDWTDIYESITVYAIYVPAIFTIEYESYGGVIAEDSTYYYTVEDSVTLPQAEKQYYIFAGWYADANFNGEIVDFIESGSVGDKKYYAKWIEREYTVSYVLNGGVNNDKNTNKGVEYVYTIESEDWVLNIPTKSGYKFVNWIDEDENVVTVISSANPKSYTVYAVWEIINYSILYELNGGENSVDNPDSYTAESGEIILANPSKYKCRFMGWYDNPECIGECIDVICGTECRDIMLYAKWLDIFTVESVGDKNIITAYNYSYGTDIVVPYCIDGKQINGIASGVMKDAESVELKFFVEINEDAFAGCDKLKNLKLPSTLKSLPSGMLADCTCLESLTVPYVTDRKFGSEYGNYNPLCTLFGKYEKDNCYAVAVRTVSYVKSGSDSEIKIADNFENYECYVPNTLKSITVLGGDVPPYALYGLESVREIIMLGDVQSVGTAAMMDCTSLKRVIISSETETVSASAFLNCSDLNEIYLHESADESIISGVLIRLNGQDILVVKYADIKDVINKL